MKIIILLLLLITALFSNVQISYFEQKDLSNEQAPLKETFTPLKSNKSNFGFTSSIFWVKVELLNSTETSTKRVLALEYALLDYIDIYELVDGVLILKKEMGDLRKYNYDSLLNSPTYYVALEAGEKKTLIYRVQTQSSMNLHMKHMDYEEYVGFALQESKA